MAVNKIVGKASTIFLAGVNLPFTKISPKVDRKLADTTDSTSYDVSSDMLWQTQLPAKLGQVWTIEGWYDTILTPSAIVAVLYTGGPAFLCTFTLKSGVIYGHGQFDISGFQLEDPIDDTVSYSMDLMSNGVFVQGS